MARPFLPYAKQSINEADIAATATALKGDWITRGPTVEAFERAVADYCHAKYAIAFNSGTTALYAACHAVDVSPHDRLITTPNTFVATAAAGMHKGARAIFVDIDRTTGNLNIDRVIDNLEPLTRGRHIILPVHFSGIPVDMQKLDSLICDPDAIVIEDAAHAIGSTYTDGKKVGCCAGSHMTMFSFHPAKTITTGEGGLITTNDEVLYNRLKRYRNNGIEKQLPLIPFDGYYEVMEMTGNFNFTEQQAALGLSQLQRIEKFIAKRRELMAHYRHLLRDDQHIKLFTDAYDAHTAFHICVAQIDFAAYNTTRGAVIEQLKERGIGTQVHYIPLYRQPFIQQKSGDISEYFPEMEAYYAQALTLPLYYDLEPNDVEYVVTTLKDVLQQQKHAAQAETVPAERHEKHHRHVRRMRR